MPHCPNPDCRHLARTGKPAEYREGTDRCGDCGTALAAGAPPAKPRTPRHPWPPGLLRRLGLTVAAMVLVTALGWLPHPLLDHELQASLTNLTTAFGPFSLGVRPLMVGFVLVELGALILPFTRQRRRQDPLLRRKLWLLGAALGVALAWVQGLSLAFALESMGSNYSPDFFGGYGGYGGYGPPLVTRAGWLFRLATAGMTAIGVGCLAVVVRWLDRRGLGPGMAALLLADGLVVAGHGLVRHGRGVTLGESSLFFALLMLLALGGLLVGAWWLLGRTGEGRDALPACLPTTGLLPYELAFLVLMIPSYAASLIGGGADKLVDLFHPGGGPWLLVAIPVVLLTAPVAATLYHWRRRQWWSGPQRSRWLALVAASAGLVVVVVVADAWSMRAAPLLMALGVTGWLALVALAGDAWTEITAWRRLGCAPSELARHQDVADALEQLRDLRAGDPDGTYVLAGLRFRSLTYFFGPYVPLRILGAPSTHSRIVAP